MKFNEGVVSYIDPFYLTPLRIWNLKPGIYMFNKETKKYFYENIFLVYRGSSDDVMILNELPEEKLMDCLPNYFEMLPYTYSEYNNTELIEYLLASPRDPNNRSIDIIKKISYEIDFSNLEAWNTRIKFIFKMMTTIIERR